MIADCGSLQIAEMNLEETLFFIFIFLFLSFIITYPIEN